MTFALNAAGTRHDVIASLKNTPVQTALGREVREMIVRHLEADSTGSYQGWHQAYVVEANGYGGDGSSLALTISVKAITQAAPAKTEPRNSTLIVADDAPAEIAEEAAEVP